MPTIEFDDQFVLEPAAPVRERYDMVAILRRNVANLEIALKQQTERAKAAEAELLAVREDNHAMMLEVDGMRTELAKLAQQAATAPSVPAEWREVMAELTADVQAACDAEHPHRDQYPSVMRKYNNDMEIVEKARALLQSAEVKK